MIKKILIFFIFFFVFIHNNAFSIDYDYGPVDCLDDVRCFSEYSKKCEKSIFKYESIKDRYVTKYEILGQNGYGSCVFRLNLSNFFGEKSIENKPLECSINYSYGYGYDFNFNMNEFLDKNCTGEIKNIFKNNIYNGINTIKFLKSSCGNKKCFEDNMKTCKISSINIKTLAGWDSDFSGEYKIVGKLTKINNSCQIKTYLKYNDQKSYNNSYIKDINNRICFFDYKKYNSELSYSLLDFSSNIKCISRASYNEYIVNKKTNISTFNRYVGSFLNQYEYKTGFWYIGYDKKRYYVENINDLYNLSLNMGNLVSNSFISSKKDKIFETKYLGMFLKTDDYKTYYINKLDRKAYYIGNFYNSYSDNNDKDFSTFKKMAKNINTVTLRLIAVEIY